MARSPQLVLDGAVLAAEITGASEAVIVVHRDVREIIDEAVAERAPGSPRPGTAQDPHGGGWLRGRAGQRGRALGPAGCPGTHRDAAAAGQARPARCADAGAERGDACPPRAHRPLRRRLVPLCGDVGRARHDAGHRARRGASAGRARGRHRHPGRAGCCELAGGASAAPAGAVARRVLRRLGGRGPGAGPAVLLGRAGGPGRRARGGPGRGAARRTPAGSAETARVVRYLAGESAGQCGPCRFGLAAIAGAGRAARGRPQRRPGAAAAVARAGRRPRRLRPSRTARCGWCAVRCGRSAPRWRITPEAGAPACGQTSCLSRSAVAGDQGGPAASGLHRLRRPGPVRRGPARADNPRRLGVPDRQRPGRAVPRCWATRARPSGRVPSSRSGSTPRGKTRSRSPCRRDSSGRPAAAPSPSVTKPPPDTDRPMVSVPPEASARRRATSRSAWIAGAGPPRGPPPLPVLAALPALGPEALVCRA